MTGQNTGYHVNHPEYGWPEHNRSAEGKSRNGLQQTSHEVFIRESKAESRFNQYIHCKPSDVILFKTFKFFVFRQ
jgi:hypothetical protein